MEVHEREIVIDGVITGLPESINGAYHFIAQP